MIEAERVKKRRLRRGTGLETLVDTTALVLLVIGMSLAALVLLTKLSFNGFVDALQLAMVTFVLWLFLRCLAEGLRLLKKIAGEEFEGRITGPYEDWIYVCSNCNNVLHNDDRCEICGAVCAGVPASAGRGLKE